VAIVSTNVFYECIASIIRVKRVGVLGTTLAVTNITSQKVAFFIVTAVKTSNFALLYSGWIYGYDRETKQQSSQG
jgi:hypothetical protein